MPAERLELLIIAAIMLSLPIKKTKCPYHAKQPISVWEIAWQVHAPMEVHFWQKKYK